MDACRYLRGAAQRPPGTRERAWRPHSPVPARRRPARVRAARLHRRECRGDRHGGRRRPRQLLHVLSLQGGDLPCGVPGGGGADRQWRGGSRAARPGSGGRDDPVDPRLHRGLPGEHRLLRRPRAALQRRSRDLRHAVPHPPQAHLADRRRHPPMAEPRRGRSRRRPRRGGHRTGLDDVELLLLVDRGTGAARRRRGRPGSHHRHLDPRPRPAAAPEAELGPPGRSAAGPIGRRAGVSRGCPRPGGAARAALSRSPARSGTPRS